MALLLAGLPDEILSMILVSSTLMAPSPAYHRRTVMLVSQRMRSVICSTACLWEDISAVVPLSSYPIYLERAKRRAITLTLSLRSDKDLDLTIKKFEAVGDRLAHLAVSGRPTGTLDLLTQITPLPPNLLTFALIKDVDDARIVKPLPTRPFRRDFLRNCSSLQELTIRNGGYLHARFHAPFSLRALTLLNVPNLNALMHILSGTPNLRHLSFESKNSSCPASLKTVSLPDLETLEASVLSGGIAEKFFRSLSLPVSTRLSVTIRVTIAGLSGLDNDLHAVTSHAKGALSERLVSLRASADGRYFERDAVSVCCYTSSRARSDVSSHHRDGSPHAQISLSLKWDHPWPLQREEAFERIMQALPTKHIDEVALCTTGPPLRMYAQEFYYPHGVRAVMAHLSHVSTVAISSQVLDEIIFSVVSPQLRRLCRIIAIASQWHAMDVQYPRLLGTLFGERRDEGLGEVVVELREGENVYEGKVVDHRGSSSYKPCEP